VNPETGKHRGPCSRKPPVADDAKPTIPPPPPIAGSEQPIDDQISLATQALAHLGVPSVRVVGGMIYISPKQLSCGGSPAVELCEVDGGVCRMKIQVDLAKVDDGLVDRSVLEAVLRRLDIEGRPYSNDRKIYEFGGKAITITHDGFVHACEFNERPALTP